jgi:hypothetical protein
LRQPNLVKGFAIEKCKATITTARPGPYRYAD